MCRVVRVVSCLLCRIVSCCVVLCCLSEPDLREHTSGLLIYFPNENLSCIKAWEKLMHIYRWHDRVLKKLPDPFSDAFEFVKPCYLKFTFVDKFI